MKHVSFANMNASSLLAAQDFRSALSDLPFPAVIEGALEPFIQQTADPVLVLDAQHCVIWANASALAQVAPAHVETAALLWEEIWPIPSRAEAFEAFDTAFDQGHSHFSAQTIVAGGTARHWDVTLTHVWGLVQRTPHVIAVARETRLPSVNWDMHQTLRRHSLMLDIARVAIASDWIKPYYQPKVDLQSGRMVGVEALLRWQRPGGKIHLPASMLAAFDDPELARLISEVMLKKVLADIQVWKQAGSALPVAVNASAADFRDTDFAEKFVHLLHQADIPTQLLELEVTEGVFLGVGAAEVGDALRTLNAAGVRISLDDFGTGYASLSHLKDYPVDVIKIDRSFVSNLPTNPDDRAIVKAMISLGRNLAIEVVAEGIESTAQATLLRDLGCHTGQGFLFSRAVPAAEVPGISLQYRIGGGEPKTLDT